MTSTFVLIRPLPLPPLTANGETLQTKLYEGDPSVFEGAQAILTTVLDPIDATLIAQLPDSIKLIASIGVGYDHIDLEAASARGISVTTTPVVTEDTADLAFLLILAASRQLTANERFLREGQWSDTQPVGALGKTVHGTRLGIIGFGEIGQAVARRARAFNMEILYHGPNPKPEAAAALEATFYADLDAMLGEADIVSINCPLNESTRHIMNAERISAMKPDAVLINTGRGPLVDEQALVDAMKGGHLAAAGLDVYEDEPKVNPGLLTLPNVTLAPHIGSATAQCRGAMVGCAIKNILAFFEERDLLTKIN
ncbi:2-hydroxyacid dehydrogenase [Aestuariirhabdus litorea]|uniref:D-glycerate dehydrogenase n=1 Tax=Aestuariirhabdus litorea TaxID=2528527 RepID=A0A3P3VUF7_9GAMM|nr:D-glycerate dehydrogenase [Aestuariirhabdus litorea]RRJ85079.1 D-glycerate dehydrogenase [Aestuariirhabdus litorea]RWW98304.1 D-glycerate dehydrogenase [Endozoicomonadaceae bacterium GTF-13]